MRKEKLQISLTLLALSMLTIVPWILGFVVVVHFIIKYW